MAFNSYSYLLFLAAAVIGFWLLPAKARRVWVLAVSIVFYASWNILFVVLPFTIAAIAYFCRLKMQDPHRQARAWLYLGIGCVLAVLGFFKYRTFLFDNVGLLAGNPAGSFAHILPAILLPLGISFYSFEAISYLLDSRQGRVPADSGFMDICLFVAFWPHLIAGPIVRVRELVPQLKFDRPFQAGFLLTGLDRFVWGLIQKNVFANSLGAWVDDGFLPKWAGVNTTFDNWALAVSFGLQIYFDFAAYSNMAIGAAQMIGVRLPENFRYPYHAGTPADFWSRWHMTLSRWIRDYLFFPLTTRFQQSPLMLYVSLIITMSLVGLWHGAGWGFVVWGTMHGAYLVIYRAGDAFQRARLPRWNESRVIGFGWRAFTLLAVAAAWIPFRASSIHAAGLMLSSMFWRFDFGLSYSVNFYLVTLALCLFCLIEPYLGWVRNWWDTKVSERPVVTVANSYLVRPMAYAFALLLFAVFDEIDKAFIYFQF